MRYLLDTHVLIWIARGEEAFISPRVSSLLIAERGSICVSAVSAWEMATKHRIGKLPRVGLFLEHFEERALQFQLGLLPISVRHGLLAGKLEGAHQDPFDRILAAQALLENLALLSNDRELDAFGVRRVW